MRKTKCRKLRYTWKIVVNVPPIDRNVDIGFGERTRNVQKHKRRISRPENVVETDHNMRAVKLLKRVIHERVLNIREAIEMSKNRNNSLGSDLNPIQKNLLKSGTAFRGHVLKTFYTTPTVMYII